MTLIVRCLDARSTRYIQGQRMQSEGKQDGGKPINVMEAAAGMVPQPVEVHRRLWWCPIVGHSSKDANDA